MLAPSFSNLLYLLDRLSQFTDLVVCEEVKGSLVAACGLCIPGTLLISWKLSYTAPRQCRRVDTLPLYPFDLSSHLSLPLSYPPFSSCARGMIWSHVRYACFLGRLGFLVFFLRRLSCNASRCRLNFMLSSNPRLPPLVPVRLPNTNTLVPNIFKCFKLSFCSPQRFQIVADFQ